MTSEDTREHFETPKLGTLHKLTKEDVSLAELTLSHCGIPLLPSAGDSSARSPAIALRDVTDSWLAFQTFAQSSTSLPPSQLALISAIYCSSTNSEDRSIAVGSCLKLWVSQSPASVVSFCLAFPDLLRNLVCSPSSSAALTHRGGLLEGVCSCFVAADATLEGKCCSDLLCALISTLKLRLSSPEDPTSIEHTQLVEELAVTIRTVVRGYLPYGILPNLPALEASGSPAVFRSLIGSFSPIDERFSRHADVIDCANILMKLCNPSAVMEASGELTNGLIRMMKENIESSIGLCLANTAAGLIDIMLKNNGDKREIASLVKAILDMSVNRTTCIPVQLISVVGLVRLSHLPADVSEDIMRGFIKAMLPALKQHSMKDGVESKKLCELLHLIGLLQASLVTYAVQTLCEELHLNNKEAAQDPTAVHHIIRGLLWLLQSKPIKDTSALSACLNADSFAELLLRGVLLEQPLDRDAAFHSLVIIMQHDWPECFDQIIAGVPAIESQLCLAAQATLSLVSSSPVVPVLKCCGVILECVLLLSVTAKSLPLQAFLRKTRAMWEKGLTVLSSSNVQNNCIEESAVSKEKGKDEKKVDYETPIVQMSLISDAAKQLLDQLGTEEDRKKNKKKHTSPQSQAHLPPLQASLSS